MTFQIEVLKGSKWYPRTVVPADSANKALKQYGIFGTRPRLGEATSRSGKRFRAVPVTTARKSRKRR